MMWAKQNKRMFSRPRLAMMSIYTVTLCLISLAAFAQGDVYRVTLAEAEAQIADEIHARGVDGELDVSIIGRRSEDLVAQDQPVVMEIEHMELDEGAQRFSATLSFATEADLNRPSRALGRMAVAGRYETLVDVPVVKFRLGQDDIIREADIEWQKVPTSRTRRDTITEGSRLLGMSPVRSISPGRPIRTSEVEKPPVVLRAKPVQMAYETDRITIKAVGTALQDGAIGERIKVRNDDSGNELSAVVVDRGRVRVLPAMMMAVK